MSQSRPNRQCWRAGQWHCQDYLCPACYQVRRYGRGAWERLVRDWGLDADVPGRQ